MILENKTENPEFQSSAKITSLENLYVYNISIRTSFSMGKRDFPDVHALAQRCGYIYIKANPTCPYYK